MSSIEKDTWGSVSPCVLCTTVRSAWTLLLAELVDTGVTRIAVGNVEVDWDWACDWNRAYTLLLMTGLCADNHWVAHGSVWWSHVGSLF